MKLPTLRFLPLTAAIAVIGVAAAVSGVALAQGSSEPSRDGRCLSLGEGVTERTIRYDYLGSPPSPTPLQKVGDTVTYYDEIYDTNKKVIGHTLGYVTGVYLDSPGHLVTEYHETVELPDGRLTTTGFMDRVSMITGGTVHLQAIGRSGKFAGKTGYRDWALKKPIPKPLTNAAFVTVKQTLCG